MDIRYQKNIDEIFTQELQNKLLQKNIGVIGCGAIGGYILEYLSRLGVNSISFWDGDIYETSNLNRQIGCTENTIGLNKAYTMKKRLTEINSSIILKEHQWFFGDNENDTLELFKCDFIFMGADGSYNIKTIQSNLQQVIKKNIPVIICPAQLLGGSVFIHLYDIEHFNFYIDNMIYWSKNDNPTCSVPAYKCALVAAEAVNQMVQYFDNNKYASIDSELKIDIYHHKYIQSDRFGIF